MVTNFVECRKLLMVHLTDPCTDGWGKYSADVSTFFISFRKPDNYIAACRIRYIETDPKVDLKDLGPGSLYRSNPRVGEWEGLMDSFFEQGGWDLMEHVYTLTNCTSSNTEKPIYRTQ